MAQLTIQQAFDLARQHHQAGHLREAEQLYRQILAQQPGHADALHLLGILAIQAGRNDVAVGLIRQAIALTPNNPEAHNNLGIALNGQGRMDESVEAYRQAIALKSDYPEAHNNLGIVLNDRGDLDEAIAAAQQAIQLRPDYAEAHNTLGNALKDKGRLDEAVEAYRQAIAFKPNFAQAFSNLGSVLNGQGHPDEAIAAYHQAIALNPGSAEAHNNLGNALKGKGLLDEAIVAFRQAVALKPSSAEAQTNLGSALKDAGQLDDAIAAYRQAVTLNPNDPKAHSNLVFTLHFHPGFDAPAIAQEQHHWAQQHAEPLRHLIQPHANDRSPERRLRIGYVSPDFRQHVVGYNMLPLIAHHNPGNFEIHCYAQVVRPDAFTQRFRAAAHHWRDLVGLSDQQAADRIRQDKIDILVDLALHMAHNRLPVFARKPAPVQATFAGYPGSTGLSTIDYRLSDAYLDPPGMDESVYSEQTIRLADSFWCYDPLDEGDVPINALPALTHGYVTFGCLNNLCKINDAVLRLWAKVLHAVARSRLLLLAPEGSARQRTLALMEKEGVDPERIAFASRQPRRQYLELYRRIDLGLDSFPYNGHTTSLESFWMGVPVVTLVGQTVVGRAGLSQLMNLNLPELIGQSPDQFVQIAAALANDLPHLARLRATLRQRMEQSPLMDAPRFARNIETAYREMWRKWCPACRPGN